MGKIISVIVLILICSLFSVTNAEKNEVNIGAWIVYWDVNDGIKEWMNIQYDYDNISFFEAYFNEDKQLFIPNGLVEVIKQQPTRQKYFTIVNDVKNKDKVISKDIKVLKSVLSSRQKREKHAEEIISLVKKTGCKGIDLDYEKVFRDEKVAKLYLDFVKILYDKARAENLQLRVILEPSVDFKAYKFPQGPMYIVMLYNLYGTHSKEDGPKADFAFIENVINKMQYLPQNRGVAFSTGGCIWSENSSPKFISTTQAITLAQQYKKIPERKVNSDAMFFYYKNESGIENKIWYADKNTISAWINKAKELGIKNIVLWRLGDNESLYDF